MKLKLFLLNILFITNTYAWNQLGHKLVAQVAYDYLTPHAKTVLTAYNKAAAKKYGARSWVNLGPWLDSYRDKAQPDLQSIHYINIPFSRDNTPLKAPKPVNIVVAIEEATAVLKNPHASLLDKGFNLRVLIHLVGDINQPMHAVSEYSSRRPQGDKGGNLFYLKNNPISLTLHSYWDNGGGLLKPRKRYSSKIIKKKAHALEKIYPCHSNSVEIEPAVWANKSYNIAIEQAYQINFKEKPSREYQMMVKKTSDQQIALAGCQLAWLLNEVVKYS